MSSPLPRPWTASVALALLLLLTAASAPGQTGNALRIVAHPGISEQSLDKDELQRIYLGKRTRWSDGTRIIPAMLNKGSLHETFVEEWLDRSSAKFMTYWKQMVFTGRGIPPRSFSSERELLDFIEATPGAIGYTSEPVPPGVITLELQ